MHVADRQIAAHTTEYIIVHNCINYVLALGFHVNKHLATVITQLNSQSDLNLIMIIIIIKS